MRQALALAAILALVGCSVRAGHWNGNGSPPFERQAAACENEAASAHLGVDLLGGAARTYWRNCMIAAGWTALD